ncbi:MAG: Panacea domain-containing protein [Hormoscilla sp.]
MSLLATLFLISSFRNWLIMLKVFILLFTIAPYFQRRSQRSVWTHGPVVPELYEYYHKYGNGAIPCPTEIDFTRYDEETRSLLDEVYSVFGQYSAWKLRNMTQAESPWQAASLTRSPISHRSMKDYFNTQLNYEAEAA